MRKKKLEKTQPAEAPKYSGQQHFVIRAKIQPGNILELDIWENPRLEKRQFICRHFVKKDGEYSTLFMNKQYWKGRTYSGWSSGSLEWILNKGDCYYAYPKSIYMHDRKIINVYFGEVMNVFDIMQLENEKKQEKKTAAQERKEERIEQLMDRVGWLSDDDNFNNWLNTVIFPNRYIFRQNHETKRGYRCHCTTCKSVYFSKEAYKHNTVIECKKCKTASICKTKTFNITEECNILVPQPYDDEKWLLRHFKYIKCSGVLMNKPHCSITQKEKVRMFIGAKTKIYYNQRNTDEIDSEWWDTKNGTVISKKTRLYTGWIKELPASQSFKSTLIAAAGSNDAMDYNELIWTLNERPYLEYLIKARLYKLADIEIKRWGYASRLDLNAQNLSDMLKISPQRVNRLKLLNGGTAALELLQHEEMTGEKISQENIEFADKENLSIRSLYLDRTHMKANKMLGYMKRQLEINKISCGTWLNYYWDYLNMAEERGADLTDDIIRANKKMLEYHNKYLEEKNRAADEKYAAEMSEKYKNISRDYERNKGLFEWTGEKFSVIAPQDCMDIIKEGRALHHCVAASKTYFERMDERESYILFLRRNKSLQAPYYTLEVKINKGIKVVQCYAAYDRQPDIASVRKELAKWKKEIIKREEFKNGRTELQFVC